MTPQQIALVRETFETLVPVRDRTARLFYERLFLIDPSTRPLFRADLASQGAKLMAALSTVVGNLHNLDAILENVCDLARRHVQYGVARHHYASVGSALLWALGQVLGPAYTAEVGEAWSSAYQTLAEAMIEAAEIAPLPLRAVS
jgi:nitric oxide dioxygenase